jgi:hypothetical protein
VSAHDIQRLAAKLALLSGRGMPLGALHPRVSASLASRCSDRLFRYDFRWLIPIWRLNEPLMAAPGLQELQQQCPVNLGWG